MLVARLEMQVAQHAVLRAMQLEVEIHHHCRPGKEQGRLITVQSYISAFTSIEGTVKKKYPCCYL